MFDAQNIYFAAWIGTIIAYIWGVIYAVGRVEGELNGMGKRLDALHSDLKSLERRLIEAERSIIFYIEKGEKKDGGNKDTGSEKSTIY